MCHLLTHVLSSGTDECYNLLKDVKETLDDFVRKLLFSVDVESTRYYVDSNSTSIDGASTCDPGSAPVFYYCGKLIDLVFFFCSIVTKLFGTQGSPSSGS